MLLSFDKLVCVGKRKFIVREISFFREPFMLDYGLAQHSVQTDHKKAAGESSENCFLFIQSYYACKMRCNYTWNEIAVSTL